MGATSIKRFSPLERQIFSTAEKNLFAVATFGIFIYCSGVIQNFIQMGVFDLNIYRPNDGCCPSSLLGRVLRPARRSALAARGL